MRPKLRIFSDGKHTYTELCGKTIGEGISSISFSHDASKKDGVQLELRINLESFEFMKDGYFDEAVKKYMEYESLKKENNERLQ